MNEYTQLVIILATIVGTWGSSFVKIILDNKKRKKDTEIVNESLEELKTEIKILKSNDDFKNLLQETIRQKSTQIIGYSTLSDTYKNILASWSKEIEDLAFKFYYSKSRDSEEELNKYLNIEATSKISHLNDYQNSLISESKPFKDRDVAFSTFMRKNSKVFSIWHRLIDRLIENGLGRDKLPKIFEDAVVKILEANIDGFILWEQL